MTGAVIFPRCSERARMLDAATRLCRIGFELRGALIREGQPLDYDTMHAALLRADVAVTDLGCALHGDEQGAEG